MRFQINMLSNEVEALCRTLSESTNGELSLDDARDTVRDFLPEFIDQYVRSPKIPSVKSPKDFHIAKGKTDNKRMAFFLGQAKAKYNLPVQDDYVKNVINDPEHYLDHQKQLFSDIAHEKQLNNLKFGQPLEDVLSGYVSSSKMAILKNLYTGSNETVEPRDNSSKEQVKGYNEYTQKVGRASQILDYLNNNNINMRVDVDDKNSSELAAYLPEYGNMKVTLMSNDPQNIGKVNTWNNIVSFSRKVDATKLPPETLIDTVINPDVVVDKVDPLRRFKNKPQLTSLHRADMPNAEIFTTSTSKVLKSMNDFVASYKQELRNAISNDKLADIEKAQDPDHTDDNGQDEDSTKLDITPEDKIAEIAKRAKNDFKPINTVADAKHEHDIHGLFATIYKQGRGLGLQDMQVYKNSAGVYKYTYNTINPKTKTKTPGYGIIGGYIPPEKNGSNKIVVNGKLKGYSVPGMRAYIDTKTGNLTVKRFNSILREKVRENMMDQILNPDLRGSVKSFSALDTLYTTDSYSTIVQLGVNSPKYEDALIKTLRNRVRLSNEVVESGNAFNEDPDFVKGKKNKEYRNKRQQMLATRDMRTIPEEWQNVVDREMTGIGKTMGASLFIGDDVKINKDGTLTPNPNTKHTKSALHNLDLFQWNKYDPVDRNIMAFNQAIRNVPMDQVNVAMMTMSGYTENDATVITAKYAKNHQIKGNDGKLRPLKTGDKITDFHGNKSIISEVIDPDEKDPARKKRLAREIAIVKANPDLDVIVNPYSSISRLNTGSAHEMQDRGGMTHLKDATYTDDNGKEHTIKLNNITMGKETYAVAVGQRVDEKTKVYDRQSYIDGKARNFSHQLAMACASADLPKTLNYVYSHNMNPGWAKFMDDLHVMGYDVDKEHHVGYLDYDKDNITMLKMPDKKEIETNISANPHDREWAHTHNFRDALRSAIIEAKTKHGPIVMQLPTAYTNAAKQKTDKIVIPYEQIKADAILHKRIGAQDSKATSVWMNECHEMYDYAAGIKLDRVLDRDKDGKPKLSKYNHYMYKDVYAPDMPAKLADNMTRRIIAKDFGGKKNIVKSDIYSAPMPDSATTVMSPDPNLPIDTVAVGPDVYDNFHLKDPSEKVAMWRDPILRDGGMRFVHVIKDDHTTGARLNPAIVKSMDMDFDGDTAGFVAMHNPEVQKEMEKLSPSKNLLNPVAKVPESYLETGLELQGSLYRQGDVSAQKELADPNVTPEKVEAILKKGFNNDAAYGIGLYLTNKETYLSGIEKLIESGAKGHYQKDANGAPIRDANNHIVSADLDNVAHYYDGKRNDEDIKEFMQGLSIKVDGVGPAGKIQQNLMYALRNHDPKDAMELTQRPTQITLQAKHNAGGKAVKNEHAVLKSIPNVFRGQKANATMYQKYTVSGNAFENELDKIYNQDMGLNIASEPIHRLAMNLLSPDGHIMTEKQRAEKLADPIDLIAYKNDSVLTTLNDAIASGTPIASGRYTKEFAMPNELLSDRVLGQQYDNEKTAEEDNLRSLDDQIQEERAAEAKKEAEAKAPNKVTMDKALQDALNKIDRENENEPNKIDMDKALDNLDNSTDKTTEPDNPVEQDPTDSDDAPDI